MYNAKNTKMKKTIITTIVTVFLALSACEQSAQKDEDTELEHKTEESIHAIKQGDVEILTIDGCQYIVYKEAEGANHAYGYMAHKGNCNNPIHCYQNPNIDKD